MLRVDDVSAAYGKVLALRELSLEVHAEEVVVLLGANGAGKSTTLRAISGVLPVAAGAIHFAGEPIHRCPPDQLVRRGLTHVPEGRHVFRSLTVLENLRAGAFVRGRRAPVADDLARVFDLFPVLAERRQQLAGTLSGGEQQMLAIGRGLMARPRFLMLDEPSLGLAPIVIDRIFDAIVEINQQGTTLLMVEQNAHLALEIADRAYVLAAGRLVLEGDAADLAERPSLREAYLGRTKATTSR